MYMFLANGSVQIANGSIRILNFAGSVPPASEIIFAGPTPWDVKTDTAIGFRPTSLNIWVLYPT